MLQQVNLQLDEMDKQDPLWIINDNFTKLERAIFVTMESAGKIKKFP